MNLISLKSSRLVVYILFLEVKNPQKNDGIIRLIQNDVLDEQPVFFGRERRGGFRYWSLCRFYAMFALEEKKAVLASYSNGGNGNGGFKVNTPLLVGSLALLGVGLYLYSSK